MKPVSLRLFCLLLSCSRPCYGGQFRRFEAMNLPLNRFYAQFWSTLFLFSSCIPFGLRFQAFLQTLPYDHKCKWLSWREGEKETPWQEIFKMGQKSRPYITYVHALHRLNPGLGNTSSWNGLRNITSNKKIPNVACTPQRSAFIKNASRKRTALNAHPVLDKSWPAMHEEPLPNRIKHKDLAYLLWLSSVEPQKYQKTQNKLALNGCCKPWRTPFKTNLQTVQRVPLWMAVHQNKDGPQIKLSSVLFKFLLNHLHSLLSLLGSQKHMPSVS